MEGCGRAKCRVNFDDARVSNKTVKAGWQWRFYGPTKAESYDPAFHLINFTGVAAPLRAILRGRALENRPIVRLYVCARAVYAVGAMKNAVFAVA